MLSVPHRKTGVCWETPSSFKRLELTICRKGCGTAQQRNYRESNQAEVSHVGPGKPPQMLRSLRKTEKNFLGHNRRNILERSPAYLGVWDG